MDTDSLNYHFKEHFNSYDSSDFLNVDEDSQSVQDSYTLANGNNWEWEVERELNGDVALIPMSSEVGMSYLSNSPPAREDFQKIMSDWQQFINIEVPDLEDISRTELPSTDEENITYIIDTAPNPSLFNISSPSHSSFDLVEKKPPTIPIYKSAGKKIDVTGQCYVVAKTEPDIDVVDHILAPKLEYDSEGDDVDIDTISDTPALEAGDLNSLLEQFEATETSQHYLEPGLEPPSNDELFEVVEPPMYTPKIVSKEPAIPEVKLEIKTECINKTKTTEEITVSDKSVNNAPVDTTITNNKKGEVTSNKTKSILDALPEELIKRIKASSKRKVVRVIDAIPAKRRIVKKSQVEVPPIQEKVENTAGQELVQLDHDYCGLATTPYPKYPKKDSGFESGEEEDQRNILKHQPTVKGANGKLMVSLLKANTIRNNAAVTESEKKKRKLNLEEYKKRRIGLIRTYSSCDNSQGSSPINSGRNSPMIIEDENARLLKHQQKLMQMAAEVLNTPPKSARNAPGTLETQTEEIRVPPQALPLPPDNIEVKVVVSIGVNTDNIGQYVPVSELEEIKPILENATTKINNNSLITSVIENIQNKKKALDKAPPSNETQSKEPHGEDKTILYLDKSRAALVTKNVESQTDEIVTEVSATNIIRRRNSNSSSSSCSSNDSRSSIEHRKSAKRRSISNDSRYSYSSQSCCSSSRSRSRSPSPHRFHSRNGPVNKDRERIREVEERRIVYVGGISPNTSKEALRRRFQQFGPISNISMHFREYGDNYGFVTFAYKVDAYDAVEHGNDDPMLPRYDLSFGGRRIFCRTTYADLDNVQDELSYSEGQADNSFDNLLREAQAKLRKRKSSI